MKSGGLAVHNDWEKDNQGTADPDKKDKCTCTPLADDPECVVHANVPFGMEALTLKDALNPVTKSQKFLTNSVIVSVSLCIIAVCAILFFLIMGAAIRVFLWAIGVL